MKNLFLVLLTILIAPLASNAQSDCSLDFIIEMFEGYITVGAVDFPPGAELTWTLNGEVYSIGDDFIEIIPGILLQSPIEICVTYTSDACPDGFEFCETINFGGGGDCIDPSLIDLSAFCITLWAPVCGCNGVTYSNECHAINYGGVTSWTDGECNGGSSDCPEILSSMQQTTGPCNWIFEVEESGDGAEVTWDFGDGTGEIAGHIADHQYAENGEYIVTAYYSDPLCAFAILTTTIFVEGCGDAEGDCIIEFEYEFFDGYAIFEAYNYPDNVELVWTYNGEVYATGTHFIEVPEPNPFPEDGVTICVGYESEDCPEGVWACEWFGDDEDCELELDGWYQNGMGFFEAYGYPENANLIWLINGVVVAEGVDSFEITNPDISDGFNLCVWYINDECGVVETCEWIGSSGGGCPEEVYIIYPKWDFCSWAFEIVNGEEESDVYWDFGDGSEVEEGTYWAYHVYESDGVYSVSVEYFSASCPEGVEFQLTIIVKGCFGEVDCVNQDQIQNDFFCTEEYAPVCGCNDVTYSNECYAYYYGGVTSWVDGECTNAVNNLDDYSSWRVYPVPASNGITVDGLPEGVWQMKMYDSQGREVLIQDISNGELLYISGLSEGYYTMHILGVEGYVKRVIIQR